MKIPHQTANTLTLLRIVFIPILVGLFWIPTPWATASLLGVYIASTLTDFLDGWIARRFNQTSEFGRFLDPIADKLLVMVVIYMLAAYDLLSGVGLLAALVIITREVWIAGLREYMAGREVTIHVTKLAKWKTTIQMMALGILLLRDHNPWIEIFPHQVIGEIALVIAACMTAITGWQYTRAALGPQ